MKCVNIPPKFPQNMFLEKKIANGPRLIVAPSDTRSVTVLVLVGAGSRYEAKRERGIAHFLEHMFFKGGKIFDTPKKVSETIDAIGGDFNAFTGKEYAGYYVKCASEHRETAFSVLGDMLVNAKLDLADIDRERGVILEEMRMYEDTPMYQVGWDFEQILFGDNPMGWDQIGLEENIRSFSREDFQQFKKDLYTPENTVVVVAGNTDELSATTLTEHFFSLSNNEKKARHFETLSNTDNTVVKIRDKKTEQAHLVMGYSGLARGDQDEYSARLLSVILGGNMSSRMFLRIREEKGLCYSIHTSTDHYSDCGALSTHAGVDLSRISEAISAISCEYQEIAQKGVTPAEVQKAKSFLKGKLTLRMEDSEEIASFFGTQAILGKNIFSLDDMFAKIDAVEKSQIDALALRLLTKEKIRLSLIGPFSGLEQEFTALMQ